MGYGTKLPAVSSLSFSLLWRDVREGPCITIDWVALATARESFLLLPTQAQRERESESESESERDNARGSN